MDTGGPANTAAVESADGGSHVMRVPVISAKHPGMVAIIDAADAPLIAGKRWNWSPGKPNKPGDGSVIESMAGSPKPPLGRIILGVTDPSLLAVHVNGDRLDCRRANLVARSRSEVAKAKKPSAETIERLRPYPDPDRPGVMRVPLKGYLTQREALIDADDLNVVEGKNWNWAVRADGRGGGTVVLATTGRQVPLSRMILNLNNGRDRVRHLNGDPLDCRRGNLAVLTQAEQSQANAKMGSVNGREYTSAFKGVCRDAERGMWIAQLNCDGVHHQLGRFTTDIDAARHYDAAARLRFGERAMLNFPGELSSEQALADARTVIDNGVSRARTARLRQRELEGHLRRADCAADMGDDDAPLPAETARQLFDVTLTVWKRWQRFGWMPTTPDDGAYAFGLIERLLQACGLRVLPYRDSNRHGVYRVPLSGETAMGREALIDAAALPLVRVRRWRFAEADTPRRGEVQTMIPTENIRLHQVVMGVSGSEQIIGFRNGNPLDCRVENLVVRTPSESHANHRKQATFRGRPCTSRFKGVFRDSRRGRWHATIKKDRVQRRLGTFHDEIAAAQAYDEAAKELFGEHARLNFPDGIDAFLEEVYSVAA